MENRGDPCQLGDNLKGLQPEVTHAVAEAPLRDHGCGWPSLEQGRNEEGAAERNRQAQDLPMGSVRRELSIIHSKNKAR